MKLDIVFDYYSSVTWQSDSFTHFLSRRLTKHFRQMHPAEHPPALISDFPYSLQVCSSAQSLFPLSLSQGLTIAMMGTESKTKSTTRRLKGWRGKTIMACVEDGNGGVMKKVRVLWDKEFDRFAEWGLWWWTHSNRSGIRLQRKLANVKEDKNQEHAWTVSFILKRSGVFSLILSREKRPQRTLLISEAVSKE